MTASRHLSLVSADVSMGVIGSIPWLHFKKAGEPFTLHIIFDHGACRDSLPGISHFTEHMLLAGTDHYPDKRALLDAFDEVGGVVGAATGYPYLFLKMLMGSEKDAPFVARMLEEILVHPRFGSDAIENERAVILQEIERTDKEKMRATIQVISREFFVGTRMGIDVKGTRESIAMAAREDIVSTYDGIMRSKRALVTGGNFDAPVIAPHLIRCMELIGERPIDLPSPESFRMDTGRRTAHHPLGVHGISVLFPRRTRTDARSAAIHYFLDQILFGPNGLILNTLRHDNGLTYSVSNTSYRSKLADFFALFVEVRPEHVDRALELIENLFYSELPARIDDAYVRSRLSAVRARERRTCRTVDDLIGRYAADFLDDEKEMSFHEDLISLLETISTDQMRAEIADTFRKDRQRTLEFI